MLENTKAMRCDTLIADIAEEKKSHTGQQGYNRPSSYCIEYQSQLVEETVLRSIVGHAEERIFRRERDAIYSLRDEGTREEAFQALHQQWFEHLGLHDPLEEVLSYWPIIRTHTHRCLLVKAPSKKEICAELFVAEDSSGQSECEIRSVVIRLTAELLIQSEPRIHFLRRELLHVVDMLAPEFGYEPNLPKSDIGPIYDRLLQERYRILWDLTIDGRLQRLNFLSASVKERHWKIFKNTFQGPGQDLERVFNFFFDNVSPKHQDLISFSRAPETWFIHASLESKSRGICSLCHFPSYYLTDVKNLSVAIIDEIKKEHTNWSVAQPICQQCCDLYESRHSETDTFKEQ